MKANLVKEIVSLTALLMLIVFFVWLGLKFLGFSDDNFSPSQYFVLGVSLVIGGVVLVSSEGFNNKWLIGFILIAFGFYLFARAEGLISYSWLAKVIGILSLGTACIFGYAAILRLMASIPEKDKGE